MKASELLIRSFVLTLLVDCQVTLADVFKMSCNVEGSIEQQDDKKLPPVKVVVEIQSIGKNIFINLIGPKLYEMRISSLSTDKFQGKNLTNAEHLGVSSKNVENAQMSEIVIGREKIYLKAYRDTLKAGALVRVNFQGPCALP
jgi:hypothetical protein